MLTAQEDKIELITRTDCVYCNNAKTLLKTENKNWKERLIGTDIEREDVINQWPNNKVLPIILVNGELMGKGGGYSDLLDYLYPPMLDNFGNNS